MPRTKGPARRPIQGNLLTDCLNCFERDLIPAISSQSNALTSSAALTSTNHSKDSTQPECQEPSLFSTLPFEIRSKIWENVVQEPRIVSVHTITDAGLRAPIPPILHICHESRAIGLQQYRLAFGFKNSTDYSAQSDPACWDNHPTLQPKVYFNFEHDTLYFGRDWNHGVGGQYACFDHLKRLLSIIDLERVQKLAFNLRSNICCEKSSVNHRPYLGPWKGLKTVSLAIQEPGTEKGWVAGGEVVFRVLEKSHHEEFAKQCGENEDWSWGTEDLEVEEAVNYVRERTGRVYGSWVGSFYIRNGENDFSDIFETVWWLRASFGAFAKVLACRLICCYVRARVLVE